MEVLASVVLLAVVLSISLSVFPNMFKTNSVNEESLDAVAVAKDALVRVKDGHLKTDTSLVITTVSANSTFTALFNGGTTPDSTHFLTSEVTPLAGDYQIYYVVDPTNVDSLDLYEVTIYVVERSAIRATNYGYIVKDNLPATIVGGP